jgi:8-oxo-dGTP pyrophosphatase MutT (NUDIX family)
MRNVVIIDENTGNELKDLLSMTQFKFKANIKKFLAALLEDPTGAEPGMIFTKNGLDKNKLIKALVDNKVITKKMTIDDHDAEGNPHTARMIVKYSVPKERFNERLDALYDMLFPDAEGKINEDGAAGGGATSCSGVDGNGFGSGEFVQPLFGGISVRKKKKDKKNANLSEFVSRVINRIISEAVTGKDADKAAAIYAYCLDDKEEDYCILCAKRIEGDEKGKWNPPMGHLHVGESPKDGAVRECEEESGVKIPKSKLQVGSYEDWGRNYWVILDGTIKDWPVGKGDGENSKFEWKNVYGLFYGKDKDLEWAWNTKDFIYKFAPAELDLD